MIVAGELKKSSSLREHYDNWGNQFYIFSSELSKYSSYPYFIEKEKNIKVSNLDISTFQLKKMGCSFLISSVEINNNEKLKLKLLKVFENKKSPLQIFLYALD